jgi:hypothetical protein
MTGKEQAAVLDRVRAAVLEQAYVTRWSAKRATFRPTWALWCDSKGCS